MRFLFVAVAGMINGFLGLLALGVFTKILSSTDLITFVFFIILFAILGVVILSIGGMMVVAIDDVKDLNALAIESAFDTLSLIAKRKDWSTDDILEEAQEIAKRFKGCEVRIRVRDGDFPIILVSYPKMKTPLEYELS